MPVVEVKIPYEEPHHFYSIIHVLPKIFKLTEIKPDNELHEISYLCVGNQVSKVFFFRYQRNQIAVNYLCWYLICSLRFQFCLVQVKTNVPNDTYKSLEEWEHIIYKKHYLGILVVIGQEIIVKFYTMCTRTVTCDDDITNIMSIVYPK